MINRLNKIIDGLILTNIEIMIKSDEEKISPSLKEKISIILDNFFKFISSDYVKREYELATRVINLYHYNKKSNDTTLLKDSIDLIKMGYTLKSYIALFNINKSDQNEPKLNDIPCEFYDAEIPKDEEITEDEKVTEEDGINEFYDSNDPENFFKLNINDWNNDDKKLFEELFNIHDGIAPIDENISDFSESKTESDSSNLNDSYDPIQKNEPDIFVNEQIEPKIEQMDEDHSSNLAIDDSQVSINKNEPVVIVNKKVEPEIEPLNEAEEDFLKNLPGNSEVKVRQYFLNFDRKSRTNYINNYNEDRDIYIQEEMKKCISNAWGPRDNESKQLAELWLGFLYSSHPQPVIKHWKFLEKDKDSITYQIEFGSKYQGFLPKPMPGALQIPQVLKMKFTKINGQKAVIFTGHQVSYLKINSINQILIDKQAENITININVNLLFKTLNINVSETTDYAYSIASAVNWLPQ